MEINNITQLKKMIDETEFSDKVKDKIKEIAVKAKLRQESGKKEEDCLTQEEKNTLEELIKADMVLDAMAVQGAAGYLQEVDKLLESLKK